MRGWICASFTILLRGVDPRGEVLGNLRGTLGSTGGVLGNSILSTGGNQVTYPT